MSHSCNECGKFSSYISKGYDDEHYPTFDSFWCKDHKKFDSELIKVKVGDKVRILDTNFAWQGIEGIVYRIDTYNRIPHNVIIVEYSYTDLDCGVGEEWVHQAVVNDGCFEILDPNHKLNTDNNSVILNSK